MGLEPLDLDLRSVIMLVATFLEAMLPLLLEPFLAAMMALRVRPIEKAIVISKQSRVTNLIVGDALIMNRCDGRQLGC